MYVKNHCEIVELTLEKLWLKRDRGAKFSNSAADGASFSTHIVYLHNAEAMWKDNVVVTRLKCSDLNYNMGKLVCQNKKLYSVYLTYLDFWRGYCKSTESLNDIGWIDPETWQVKPGVSVERFDSEGNCSKMWSAAEEAQSWLLSCWTCCGLYLLI